MERGEKGQKKNGSQSQRPKISQKKHRGRERKGGGGIGSGTINPSPWMGCK